MPLEELIRLTDIHHTQHQVLLQLQTDRITTSRPSSKPRQKKGSCSGACSTKGGDARWSHAMMQKCLQIFLNLQLTHGFCQDQSGHLPNAAVIRGIPAHCPKVFQYTDYLSAPQNSSINRGGCWQRYMALMSLPTLWHQSS